MWPTGFVQCALLASENLDRSRLSVSLCEFSRHSAFGLRRIEPIAASIDPGFRQKVHVAVKMKHELFGSMVARAINVSRLESNGSHIAVRTRKLTHMHFEY